jgi:hypothetical protein
MDVVPFTIVTSPLYWRRRNHYDIISSHNYGPKTLRIALRRDLF